MRMKENTKRAHTALLMPIYHVKEMTGRKRKTEGEGERKLLYICMQSKIKIPNKPQNNNN